jgi:hypothetical protein
MWFVIASEQITQAKNHLNQSMTMEQLLEAEQRAAERIFAFLASKSSGAA